MMYKETVGRYIYPNREAPTTESQVRYIYHATHIEFALDMIKDLKLDDKSGKWEATVEFTTHPSRKTHNEHLHEGKHLLFFACDLGEGWSKKRSRYGNIMFKFLLSDVLQEFARVSNTSTSNLEYRAIGTTVYSAEYSHKVLVTTANCFDQGTLAYPLLTSISPSLRIMPLRFDENGNWWQMNSLYMEQNEFVLYFDGNPVQMHIKCEMEFHAHDDICIPLIANSSRSPVHCKVGYHQNRMLTGRSWHSSERADAEEAKDEFAAAIICEKKTHLRILFETYKDLLDERINKIRSRYHEDTNDPNYTELREFPKFYYTLRYYEEQLKLPSLNHESSAIKSGFPCEKRGPMYRPPWRASASTYGKPYSRNYTTNF